MQSYHQIIRITNENKTFAISAMVCISYRTFAKYWKSTICTSLSSLMYFVLGFQWWTLAISRSIPCIYWALGDTQQYRWCVRSLHLRTSNDLGLILGKPTRSRCRVPLWLYRQTAMPVPQRKYSCLPASAGLWGCSSQQADNFFKTWHLNPEICHSSVLEFIHWFRFRCF